MIIGLGPEYNYPGTLEKWSGKNNTRFASNHGASLISRAIIKQFDGTYVDDLSNPAELSKNFDRCIIAFATHVTANRDVSLYADFIEKLTIPVYAFSLGIQDYATDLDEVSKIHPSMKKLLKVVNERSLYIGVRGPYTASILHREGFKNVLPVGCPTVYYNMTPDIAIRKNDSFDKIAVVYHRTMCQELWHLMEGHKLVGQDFLDEVVFTDRLKDDLLLRNNELPRYQSLKNYEAVMKGIKEHGVFPERFDEWFGLIKEQDFVFGARLHGCIAALIQGVPAVMIARDIRVQEIAEFYGIPFFTYEEASKVGKEELMRKANFHIFEETYKKRYQNYLSFLELNGLKNNLNYPENFQTNYVPTINDLLTDRLIQYKSIQAGQIKQQLVSKDVNILRTTVSKLKRAMEKIPFSSYLKNKLNS